MKNLIGILALLSVVSCGKPTTNNNTIIEKKVVKRSLLENVTCNSDGSYTECTILNKARRILDVVTRKSEDCLVDVDYYLLTDSIIVARNGCKATFLVELKGL